MVPGTVPTTDASADEGATLPVLLPPPPPPPQAAWSRAHIKMVNWWRWFMVCPPDFLGNFSRYFLYATPAPAHPDAQISNLLIVFLRILGNFHNLPVIPAS
jgi:hypothetical protein